jgi:uncharacterized protein (DUF885 family)
MSDMKELDKLEEEFFYGLLERNPIMGTRMGLHQYDDLMPDGSLSAKNEFIDFMKSYRDRFENLSTKGMPDERALDREVALYFIKLALFYNDELKFWRKMPVASNAIGQSLYLVFAKDYAPFRDRMRSITRRLEKTPAYLNDGKELLTEPVKLWLQIETDSASYLNSLLDSIRETSKGQIPDREIEVLEEAIGKTKDALSEYGEWLTEKTSNASEEYTITEDEFKRLLALRKINLTPGEILDVGHRYLKNEKKKLAQLAKKFEIGEDIGSINKLIGSKKPKDFEETLSTYRKSIEDSKKFVTDKSIASIPPNEKLVVMQTPEYLAHVTPFAMYFSPAKFDKTQLGLYLVTAPRNETDIGRHNTAVIANTTVHEGYPGHHLQLSCANINTSLIRTIAHATETVEGWAHYCEELMMEKGYFDDLTAVSQTIDAIWRAARVIIDVNLSTGKMSFDEAVDMLVAEVGMSKEEAEGEIKRYTQMPSYNISYLLGKHLIKELKSRLGKKLGDRFDEKWFHDSLLYSGSLPMSFFDEVFESKMKELG